MCARPCEFDQHGWAETSCHQGAFRRIAAVQKGIRTAVRTKAEQDEAQNQHSAGVVVCVCVSLEGNSSWSQSVGESNCQWRATCSWGPEMVWAWKQLSVQRAISLQTRLLLKQKSTHVRVESAQSFPAEPPCCLSAVSYLICGSV